jgi:hypothetical protein
MIPTFTAQRILRDFRSGSSLPVLVETREGMRCVVKWKGASEGPLANVVDWIALHLARRAGIPVPTAHLIDICSALIDREQDPDINDLITRSLGINLGIEHIEHATPLSVESVNRFDAAVRNAIYLFDVLFLNIDRTDHNPNVVVAGDKIYCIDFAASMAIRMFLNKEKYSEESLLPLIRRHPFYRMKERIGRYKSVIRFPEISDIVARVPDEWLSEAGVQKARLVSGIERLLTDSHDILERRLSYLDTLPVESQVSRDERTLQNRKAFEAKLSTLGFRL